MDIVTSIEKLEGISMNHNEILKTYRTMIETDSDELALECAEKLLDMIPTFKGNICEIET